MDASLLLIEPQWAAAYDDARRSEEALRIAEEGYRPMPPGPGGQGGGPSGGGGDGDGSVVVPGSGTGSGPGVKPDVPQPAKAAKKRFYGSVELDPFLAKKQFADLVDEVVQQFTTRMGVKVRIAIEIEAETGTGFDDSIQRAVKENCHALKFKTAEFEGGD